MGQPWFSFIVHPRDVEDAARTAPGKLMWADARDADHFREKLESAHTTAIGEVRFGFQPIWGEVLAIPRLPERMIGRGVAEDVAAAVDVAIRRGATVVGLGALTSPVTRGGRRIAGGLPTGVTLTTGNALTAAVVRDNVHTAAAHLDGPPVVAVVGCTGSVGVGASRLLAADGFELVLVGRTTAAVERHLGDLSGQATLTGELGAVAGAGVVVVLTSSPTAQVQPAMTKPGSIVVDYGQPSNLDPAHLPEFGSRGVTVATGGLVRIPQYHCSYDFRFDDPGDTFACLAETYLVAREGIRGDFLLGKVEVATARMLEEVAARHGVEASPLRVRVAPG